MGCWILASEPVGQFSAHSVFWHLDKFSTVALAEQAKERTGTVVSALGKVWLLTIAQVGWRPKGGERVAEIDLVIDSVYRVHYGRRSECARGKDPFLQTPQTGAAW